MEIALRLTNYAMENMIVLMLQMNEIAVMLILISYFCPFLIKFLTDTCEQNEFQCESKECIPMSQRCDGRRDCLKDGSDELDCPTISSTPTPLSTNFTLDPKAFCIDFENLLF